MLADTLAAKLKNIREFIYVGFTEFFMNVAVGTSIPDVYQFIAKIPLPMIWHLNITFEV